MCLLVILSLVFCASLVQSEPTHKCDNKLQCVENELVESLDKIDQQPKLGFFDDFVVLEKINGSAEEAKSNRGIIERCIRFLTSHELKIRMPSAVTTRTLADEARTRKLKKIILPLLLLLKLKAAVIIPAILAVVGLTAFKGLAVSLMALTVATAVGLKSLFEGPHNSRLSYEIVPQVAPTIWSRNGIESYPAGYHTIS